MSWNPFLMKVLFKKMVLWIREQCMGPTREKLKKKEKKKRDRRRRMNVERNPNEALVIIWKAFFLARMCLAFKR